MATNLIEKISLDILSDIIAENEEELGWTIVDDDEGEEETSELNWQICEGVVAQLSIQDEEDCQLLNMSLAIQDDEATVEDINAFNSGEDVVSAFIADDGVIILHVALCIAGGVTRESIQIFLELCAEGLADLIEAEDEPEDEPED